MEMKKEGGVEQSTPFSPLRNDDPCCIMETTTDKDVIFMNKAADIIRELMDAEGVSGRELARKIGRAPSAVSSRLTNNTLTAETFFEWCDILGYEVVVQKKDCGSKFQGKRRGIGPRMRRMVGRIIFDTEKSEAICHTPERDGWFMELYADEEGRFFIAHYNSWGGENFISQAGADEARCMYDAYGDGTADEFFEGGEEPSEES